MWLAVARAAGLNGTGPPLELWPMRPDRMLPAAHPTKFIQGYVFRSGRGDIPMGLGDVVYEKKPHPTDPYRGFSPIVAAMIDLRADREAAEYNAEFFANDATPGGLVKVPGYLPQPRWDELVTRWNEQHRGRGNAHKIHFLDQVADAEYVNLGYTRKDMQFTELRSWSVEAFMRAYRISDFVLGMIKDVNRATAEAADVWFGKAHVIPRANRLRAMLNTKLLGLYPGNLSRGYEWDYDDVIPPDRAQALAEETARLEMALRMVAEGYDEAEVFEYFDLPKFTRKEPAPAPAAPPAAGPDEGDDTADGDTVEAPAARTNGHRRPAPAHA
jgi:phage portal protein BeeE